MKKSIKTVIIIFIINFALVLQGQTINRYGTTTANFLEIGVGSRFIASATEKTINNHHIDMFS